MKTYTYKYNRVIKWFKTHKLSDDIQCETHHIIPRSCGGDDSKENLVSLPLRWHYIVHCWLPAVYLEMGDQNGYEKMLFAWNRMLNGKYDYKTVLNSIKETSVLYQNLRRAYSEVVSRFSKFRSRSENNMYGKIWIVNYETHENRTIGKNDSIPEGFVVGRCMDFSKEEIERKSLLEELKTLIEKNKEICEEQNYEASKNKTVAELKKIITDKKNALKQSELVKYWTDVAVDYNQHGYEFIKDKYQIKISKTGVFSNLRKHSNVKINTDNMKGRISKTKKESSFTSNIRKMTKEKKIDFFTGVYSDFVEHGFDFVVKKYSYPNSRNSLMWSLKMYARDYIPQKCNRWG